MAKPALSVCMIVKNEAENLPEALECVKSFADEIVIVDTGSVDDTKKIASRHASRIYDFKWIDDFSAARNFAMSKATGRYHLWLDADDRIEPKHRAFINSLKSHFDGRKAFYFVLENRQNDAPPTSCLQLRCTPLIPEVRFESPIHEQIYPSAVEAGLQLVNTDIVVCHHGYTTMEARMEKARRNLAILERQIERGVKGGGIYFYLAMTYAPMGKCEQALQCMETAIGLFENETLNHHLVPAGYSFIAKLAFEMDDHDKCRQALVKLRSIAGGNPLFNYHAGILSQRIGKHQEAIRAFQDVAGKEFSPGLFPGEQLPSGSELLLHIAYSLFCMNDRQGALKLIQDSANSRPNAGRSWEWMGAKAFAFKDMGLAQLSYETALRFGDIEPASWMNLSAIYKLRGFSEKSEECRKKAAE